MATSIVELMMLNKVDSTFINPYHHISKQPIRLGKITELLPIIPSQLLIALNTKLSTKTPNEYNSISRLPLKTSHVLPFY